MIYLPGKYSYTEEEGRERTFTVKFVDYATYGYADWAFTDGFDNCYLVSTSLDTMDRWKRQEGWRYDPASW
jgi:hypothetical protein